MNSLNVFLALRYSRDVRPAIYTDGRPCYLAELPDLPGCVAYGDTVEEAEDSLDRARVAWITHHHQKGLDIPLPSDRPSQCWQTDPVPEDASAFISEVAFR